MSSKKEEVAVYTKQANFINELEVMAKNTGVSFTEYGIKCMVNAYVGLMNHCNTNGIQLSQFDGGLLRSAFQNIGYTELNYAAIPSECYFDIRKNYKEENGKKVFVNYSLVIKPQGAGNEKLLRKYGVNVKTLYPCWLVREDDEFTLPSFVGLEMSQPVWNRKSLDKKVIMVVYPVETTSGRIEYLMATRESVKANLVAHIRNNMFYKVYGEQRDKKYNELDADAEKMTFEELLANPKWREWINPNWTAGSSRESMIIRKMQNNALKNYPKEYDNAQTKEAVANMFEDYDESLSQTDKEITEVDVVAKVEDEIKQENSGDEVKDFNVEEEKEAKPEQEPQPVKVEVKKVPTDDYGF